MQNSNADPMRTANGIGKNPGSNPGPGSAPIDGGLMKGTPAIAPVTVQVAPSRISKRDSNTLSSWRVFGMVFQVLTKAMFGGMVVSGSGFTSLIKHEIAIKSNVPR